MRKKHSWLENLLTRLTYSGEPLHWDDLAWFAVVVLMVAGIVLTFLAAM